MHILKRLFGRIDGPLLHGMLAGCATMVISSLGLFDLWHSRREASAPVYDSQGRFVGVTGVDMWVRDFDARIGAIQRAGIGAVAAVALLSVFAGFVVYRLSRTASR